MVCEEFSRGQQGGSFWERMGPVSHWMKATPEGRVSFTFSFILIGV